MAVCSAQGCQDAEWAEEQGRCDWGDPTLRLSEPPRTKEGVGCSSRHPRRSARQKPRCSALHTSPPTPCDSPFSSALHACAYRSPLARPAHAVAAAAPLFHEPCDSNLQLVFPRAAREDRCSLAQACPPQPKVDRARCAHHPLPDPPARRRPQLTLPLPASRSPCQPCCGARAEVNICT